MCGGVAVTKKAVLFCWVKIIDMLLVTLLLMYNYILFYFLDLVKFFLIKRRSS